MKTTNKAEGGYYYWLNDQNGQHSNAAFSHVGWGETREDAKAASLYWANQHPWCKYTTAAKTPAWVVEDWAANAGARAEEAKVIAQAKRDAAAALGSSRSAAKQAAARVNGTRGGRPPGSRSAYDTVRTAIRESRERDTIVYLEWSQDLEAEIVGRADREGGADSDTVQEHWGGGERPWRVHLEH